MILLLLIIAIILFFVVRALYSELDNNNAGKTEQFEQIPQQNAVKNSMATPSLSFWDSWKSSNVSKASAIVDSLDRDISKLSDKDAREIVDSFTRIAGANNITDWSQIKPRTIEKMTELFGALSEERAMELLDSIIQEERAHTSAKVQNTGTYFAKLWLQESIETTRKDKKPVSSAIYKAEDCTYLSGQNNLDRAYADPEIQQIAEQFKTEYVSHIMNVIGSNANNKLFCHGYDSPISRVIMHVMYSYLRNPEFVKKAKREKLWYKFVDLIIEETNKITEKYCDADVQECIEFYNFPNKPVVTSRRCPHCGNRNVCLEDDGFECMECGANWYAPYGRNIYIDE